MNAESFPSQDDPSPDALEKSAELQELEARQSQILREKGLIEKLSPRVLNEIQISIQREEGLATDGVFPDALGPRTIEHLKSTQEGALDPKNYIVLPPNRENRTTSYCVLFAPLNYPITVARTITDAEGELTVHSSGFSNADAFIVEKMSKEKIAPLSPADDDSAAIINEMNSESQKGSIKKAVAKTAGRLATRGVASFRNHLGLKPQENLKPAKPLSSAETATLRLRHALREGGHILPGNAYDISKAAKNPAIVDLAKEAISEGAIYNGFSIPILRETGMTEEDIDKMLKARVENKAASTK